MQALPDRLLAPILSGLRGLVDHFGATVLPVSATQPSFWELSAWKGLERKAVIDDPAALFDALRRVEYEWRTGQDVTLESIAREAATHPQVPTVVGTSRDAARFHRHLPRGGAGPGRAAISAPYRAAGPAVVAGPRVLPVRYRRAWVSGVAVGRLRGRT
ncbi:hypothetical protein ACFQ3Z_38035 [Streptomyces nogalater]